MVCAAGVSSVQKAPVIIYDFTIEQRFPAGVLHQLTKAIVTDQSIVFYQHTSGNHMSQDYSSVL